MAKAASITAGLVTKKGEAVPSAGVSVPLSYPPQPVTSKSAPYYKSLTVKLDRPRYEALKQAGIKYDKTSQDIFVEALDLWLRSNTD